MRKIKLFLLGILLLSSVNMFAQKTISGKVVEKGTGANLPGVDILIKGTTKGTSTDFDGKFKFDNLNNGDVLVFSFLGFKTEEVTITAASSFITVQLEESSETLDEIVLVGYGQVKKKDATGAVTSVTEKDFNKGNIVSPDQLLTGKVAGVQITSGGGAPGSGSLIRIRGGASLNANNDPLFVIDGVPVDKDGVSGMRNPLNTINPNDIASVNVLKDASATAIYGSRASNGVIIITTKKGKAGAPFKINYSGNVSVNTGVNKIDALTADEYRTYVSENGNAAQNALLGDSKTDWQDVIFDTAMGTDHNISATGSTDLFNYRASVGYANQDGILLTSNLKRTTLAGSIGTKLMDDHLKIDANYKLALIKNRFADTGAIGSAISMDPTQAVYSGNDAFGGYFQWLQSNGNPIAIGAPANPLSLLEQRSNTSDANRSIGNIQFDYKFHFLPELRANLNLGIDKSNSDGDNILSGEFASTYNVNSGGLGNISSYTQDKENRLLDFYLNYTKELESINSKIDLMGGYSYQNFVNEGGSVNNIQDETIKEASDFYNELNLQSFFSRLNFSLSNKYLFTFTYRRDGSSRFSENNRWGNFPSAAFAWKISEEGFLENSSAISNLKLRLGWGITGQQDIGSFYPAIATYLASTQTAQYQFGNEFITTYRAEPFNTTLKWEQTETYNIGLDFGLFKNKVDGAIEVYQRNTEDLLNFIPFPGGSSLSNAGNANIGKMENRGIEFTLNTTPVQTQDLTWNVGLNLTVNETEITQLTTNDGPDYIGIPVGGFSGGVGNNIQIHSVGFAPNSFYVYQQVYDTNGTPIEGVYVDRNDDGTITPDDRYRFENPNADLTVGFNTQLNYRNWDFNMVWRGSFGNYVYNNVNSALGFRDQLLRYDNVISNGVSNVLESQFINGGAERYMSDYYMEDASFVKLDNVSLSYDFDTLFGDTVNLKVIGSVQNVLTITDYSGLDPEVIGGIDFNIYPRPRTYMLGVNLNF